MDRTEGVCVEEVVVLLDEQGKQSGTLSKSAVHHSDTPLHLAFSCYVFNDGGELLLTRRALSKLTWPGAWTNSCCGHPLPGEGIYCSIARRLQAELGIKEVRTDLVLPNFRYRSSMGNGIVENEMCPVFRVVTEDTPKPVAGEVMEVRWVPWNRFASDVIQGRSAVSPWCELQVGELLKAGPDPLAWPRAPADELPPAARP
jgi:isopentenyl-diphosphate Delta-isomerase